MRLPGRLHISWQDDTTLKVETDAGTQTRLFHFGDWKSPGGEPDATGRHGRHVGNTARAASRPAVAATRATLRQSEDRHHPDAPRLSA